MMDQERFDTLCLQLRNEGFIDALAERMRDSSMKIFEALPDSCSEAQLRAAKASFATTKMVTTYMRNQAAAQTKRQTERKSKHD